MILIERAIVPHAGVAAPHSFAVQINPVSAFSRTVYRTTNRSSRRTVPSAARNSTVHSPAPSIVLLLNVRYPPLGFAVTRKRVVRYTRPLRSHRCWTVVLALA